MEYEVYFSAKALKQLKALDFQTQMRIKEASQRLAIYPPVVNVEKIRTRPGEFRFRVGSWRLFFRYDHAHQEVEIIVIRPREHAYD